MNIAPGQNLLSRYGFTVQKRYEPLADGLVSAAEHSARLPADIQQATDAQARELEARRVAAAAKPKNPVGRPRKPKSLVIAQPEPKPAPLVPGN